MTTPDKTKAPSRKTYGNPQRDDIEVARPFEEQNKTPSENADFHEKLAKIAGYQAVSAVFHRDPHRVIRLYFDEKMKKSVGNFCTQMARMQRPYRLVNESELQKISGTVLHGGVVAAVVPRTVPDFDIEEAKVWAQTGHPLVILDGIGNPHNLGAIARTMAYFGLKYLLISDHPAQAGLSDAAHRVAEGGLEHLEVYRAVGCAKVCKRLHDIYRVVGTSLGARAVELEKLPVDSRPLALVLGNEEFGLPYDTLNVCEATVLIPGAGRIQSLNVSATAAILIHQITAKQTAISPRSRTQPPDDGGKGQHRRNRYPDVGAKP
ncbi:MAG: RNA methyltransferase [Candidatus Methylumidiphilus alinenensis]|uniref:RNA methyltransferase n=1 Tax=Candidatus Methylumidiphilus alinenensis TaxID=2202197 RepID=A0A2W4QWM7_9GAMM|nr:MAG: RNA methyltransferase [Candidatus Methylumidiphilus alinenensis]